MDKQSILFLRSVFEEIDEQSEFHPIIKDGVLLCRLVHILAPDFEMKVDKRQITFVYGANLQNFINFCKSVGIPDSFLPAPLSVVNNDPQAIKAICTTLWLIHRFSGLGEWSSEEGSDALIDLDEFNDIKLQRIEFDPKTYALASSLPEQGESANEGPSSIVNESSNISVSAEQSSQAGLAGESKIADGEQTAALQGSQTAVCIPTNEQNEDDVEEAVKMRETIESAEQPATEAAQSESKVEIVPDVTEKLQQFKQEATDKSCYEKQNLDIIYFDEPDYKLYPTFKSDVVIIGAPGCGKTTLGMRIHEGHCRYTPQEIPSAYELTYLHEADNWPANIHLVIRETEEDKYMRECNFVFLCFAFNDMKSFKALSKYFKLIEKYGDPDVILIGLKADDRIPEITQDMIEKLLDQEKRSRQNSLRYHSVSALKGYGVKSLLDGLEFYMNREEEIPKKK